ncbi:MAG TPA: Bax inhibitor-1 family protein [Candidatus Saccharimonadales bacterium]|jgi:FtsH-binding integral membrane protein|nr:Bax inhibitor-1 family protein [Candidatus Saccharimonadales bacterium]
MNNSPSSYRSVAVGEMDATSRATFISRTYAHLVGAIGLFTLLEVIYFQTGVAETIARSLLGVSWLLVLGGFVVVSWLASRVAHQAESMAMQYAALLGFVVAESIIFVPLLFLANQVAPGAITSAALVTFFGFAGLTIVVFMTRKDFSFLRGILFWGGISALVLIASGVIFGFALGTYFSVGMVVLAGGAILYDTSNVLHHYPEDRYVAAALELFASVALLLWYVLRLFLSRR